MNKIDQDAQHHFNSIVDDGGIENDKDAEREASWRALRDQMPKRSRADYNKERAHVTDKRSAAKLYVKGNNFKNESKNMNKKLIRLTESDLHRIVKESVNKILNEIGDTPKGQRALGALAAARFKGKKKGDWGEPSKKASVEAIKAAEKYGHEQNNANEPWSGWKSYHKKQAELGHAYNDGYQSQVKESRFGKNPIQESGFNPLKYDSKMGWYEPHDLVDGVDEYVDFDDMSDEELYALRDKYLEQVGHTPYNKLANARPDVFHALQAIEDEIKDRRMY